MFGKMFSSDAVAKDFGLLLIRLGIGASVFIFHGYGKITAGPERWEAIGGAMGNLGVHVAPVAWGFMAAFAESVGSILLVLGPLFRTATLLLAFNMFVAVMRHIHLPAGDPDAGWGEASHALELMVVYLGLFFTGPGKFAAKLGKVD
jgi:putative oxidoreductase